MRAVAQARAGAPSRPGLMPCMASPTARSWSFRLKVAEQDEMSKGFAIHAQ